jgi:hypothetical protein
MSVGHVFLLLTDHPIISDFTFENHDQSTGQSEFYIFQILAGAPESKEWLATLAKLNQPWINILVGGLAAAAGSSYWHDKLDRIRSLKTAASNLKALKS